MPPRLDQAQIDDSGQAHYSRSEERPLLIDPPPGSVTWIKVERPVFDLVGVLTSSLSLTLLLAGGALVLGSLAGLAIIRRRRHTGGSPLRLHIT